MPYTMSILSSEFLANLPKICAPISYLQYNFVFLKSYWDAKRKFDFIKVINSIFKYYTHNIPSKINNIRVNIKAVKLYHS